MTAIKDIKTEIKRLKNYLKKTVNALERQNIKHSINYLKTILKNEQKKSK